VGPIEIQLHTANTKNCHARGDASSCQIEKRQLQMRQLDRSDDSPHSHFSTLCATLLKFHSRPSRDGSFFHQDDKSCSLPFSANIIQKVAPFMVRAEFELRDG